MQFQLYDPTLLYLDVELNAKVYCYVWGAHFQWFWMFISTGKAFFGVSLVMFNFCLRYQRALLHSVILLELHLVYTLLVHPCQQELL